MGNGWSLSRAWGPLLPSAAGSEFKYPTPQRYRCRHLDFPSSALWSTGQSCDCRPLDTLPTYTKSRSEWLAQTKGQCYNAGDTVPTMRARASPVTGFNRGAGAIQHTTPWGYSHTCEHVTPLLDEAMGRVLATQDVWALTGRLEIKFRKPVPLDQELTIVCELARSRSRAYEARGEIQLPDGTILIEGSGTYIRVPDEFVEQAKLELDFWQVVPD